VPTRHAFVADRNVGLRGWKHVQIDEIDTVPLVDGLMERPVRRTSGIVVFGVNAYESETVDGPIVGEHIEL
jgi:hypothetical protein